MGAFNELDYLDGNIDNYDDYCIKNGLSKIEECPLCYKGILPNMYGEILSSDRLTKIAILECPTCKEVFIVKYVYYNGVEGENECWGYGIKDIFPKNSIKKIFDDQINEISQKFIDTYNQSLIAETHGLDEIAGMGYRKSLEYLIKDYIIYNNPEKEEEVKKMMLGKCINTMVDNPKIQKMAKGATWLGNDATHYVQKWADKDIDDLKKLIDLTVYWIIYEMKTREYEEIMKL
ncbi:hypothetical protein [uncultured Clostridium sp.]|uniref:hypothetical protein n=1 Tax=uncultured Clostridium sp. TaxID=59620 RepID=UPI0028E72FF7|nr:hypothetical protein [uncultured Clostridium sp.]